MTTARRMMMAAAAGGFSFQDTFTDTDTTDLSAHTADTGQSWTKAASKAITISSNTAVCAATNLAIYTADSGLSSYTLNCDHYKTGGAFGVGVHVQDINNYIFCQLFDNNQLQIYTVVSGIYTKVAFTGWSAPAGWSTATITVTGTRITLAVGATSVYYDTTLYASETDIALVHGAATAGGQWDNLTVE